LSEMIGHGIPSPEAARQFLYPFHEEEKIEEAKQRRRGEEIAYIPEEGEALKGLTPASLPTDLQTPFPAGGVAGGALAPGILPSTDRKGSLVPATAQPPHPNWRHFSIAAAPPKRRASALQQLPTDWE
jgi:hypothetical protein